MTEAAEALTPREAGRALAETRLPVPDPAGSTSTATDEAVIRTHLEGRLSPDGTDEGVSVRAAARALAEERAEANKLLQQMNEPAAAIIEAAQGRVELAQAAIAEMQADPDKALIVARQIEEAAAAQAVENERLQQLTQEVERLQSEGAHDQAVATAAAAMQGQIAAAHEAKGYLSAVHTSVISTLQQRFPEFRGRNPASTVAALQAVNPLRAEAFKNEFMLADAQYSREQARVGQLIEQAQAIHAQAQQQQLAQHTAWAQNEDAKFAQLVGGQIDPQVAKDSFELLVTLGVEPATIHELWNNRVGFPLRSAPAQAVLAMAAKWARTQSNIQAERQKPERPLPTVQRPGVARSRDDIVYAELWQLDQKLSESGSIRDAMRLRSAQIKQQRRRSGP